ncbi:hypothetical protein ACFPYI_09120 [Halomarina salina]|uniref:Uncharacterized protein n=1 Tax=Halomarina salina TaxID=1872699 RepID=A0ABD5RMF3_9EURY|nr:hypothetical protein [Halomarina salina]
MSSAFADADAERDEERAAAFDCDVLASSLTGTVPWWAEGVADHPFAKVTRDAHGDVLHAALSTDARTALRSASYSVVGLTTGGEYLDRGVRFVAVRPEKAARPIHVVLGDLLDAD